tara:strand:+ start:2369 stop:2674 length:306 start_codon:yes stop_codon:yes gene_type:complete
MSCDLSSIVTINEEFISQLEVLENKKRTMDDTIKNKQRKKDELLNKIKSDKKTLAKILEELDICLRKQKEYTDTLTKLKTAYGKMINTSKKILDAIKTNQK